MQKDKTIAILQSNYIPWKGYFDIINMADEFVLYDDMQYTKRDWRSRNKIQTENGPLLLSIPIEVKGKYYQKIKDTKISDKNWAKRHWKTIWFNYKKAKYFKDYSDIFEEVFIKNKENYLSLVNYKLIKTINSILSINTEIKWSMDYEIGEGKTERLINICKQAKANKYISGPVARNYIDESLFKNADIELIWMDYLGYPEYKQLNPDFEHKVSIIDLIFNTGKDAHNYMKSFNVK